ncbi:probable endonuclease 4 [Littorina saxatilis]|uniref:Xylose isomerase-like TIM barrel domain-containing protein n=1 Tax=Littorina saxatilis TaxID=31220 RepID=A0AAN9BXY1_9CAEN
MSRSMKSGVKAKKEVTPFETVADTKKTSRQNTKSETSTTKTEKEIHENDDGDADSKHSDEGSRYSLRKKRALTNQCEGGSAKKRSVATSQPAPALTKKNGSPEPKSRGTTQKPRQARQPYNQDNQTPQGQSDGTYNTEAPNTKTGSQAPKASVNTKRQKEKNVSDDEIILPGGTAEKSAGVKHENGHGSNGCTMTASSKLVGAHCSIAGGLYKAVEEAVAMGGRAFALFLRSQRTWASKPLDPEAADKFKAACKEHGFPPHSILPHGSYLMNCGSPNPETLQKSRDALVEELKRCEALGLTLYNFHPGSTCGEISIPKSLDKIAESINLAHSQTKFVTAVIENMCCQGNTIGGRFEELKGIIDRVKDKARIGVCLDTCHAFAAGFDLSTKEGFEKFVSDFEDIVGFQYLKGMHLNDSKGSLGCHLDRHENIGKGQIGLDGFRRIMQDPRFDNIPMILETPLGDYRGEIRTLNKLA